MAPAYKKTGMAGRNPYRLLHSLTCGKAAYRRGVDRFRAKKTTGRVSCVDTPHTEQLRLFVNKLQA